MIQSVVNVELLFGYGITLFVGDHVLLLVHNMFLTYQELHHLFILLLICYLLHYTLHHALFNELQYCFSNFYFWWFSFLFSSVSLPEASFEAFKNSLTPNDALEAFFALHGVLVLGA